MKNLLILSITIFSLTSCSSNEDITKNDPFIGTWSFFSRQGVELDNCEKKTTLIVTENGVFTAIIYNNGSTTGDCELISESTGVWANKGNNMYHTDLSNSSGRLQMLTFNNDNSSFINTSTIIQSDGTTKTNTTTYKRK